MAYPRWTTIPGPLRNASDGAPYAPLQLQATDPDLDAIRFYLQAGTLPPGLSISTTGLITGTPTAATILDTPYVFVVRADTRPDAADAVDRTFSIIVSYTGAREPFSTAQATNLGTFTEGTILDLTILGNAGAKFDFVLGNLPLDTTLDESGKIRGRLTNVDVDTLYTFTLRGTNRYGTDTKTFTITVAAAVANVAPVFDEPSLNLGSFFSGSYYTKIFNAFDVNNDVTTFFCANPPDGLTLEPTGLLKGYLPVVTYPAKYTFTVVVSDGFLTDTKTFELTVLPADFIDFFWLTNAGSLGELREGDFSVFQLRLNQVDPSLVFKLIDGSLPPGLSLNEQTGDITGNLGRVDADTVFTFTISVSIIRFISAFKDRTFFDDHQTVFDDNQLRFDYGQVNEYEPIELETLQRTFSITAINVFAGDPINIYGNCAFSAATRLKIREDIFSAIPANDLYRPGDPNFEVPKRFEYLLASGLKSQKYAHIRGSSFDAKNSPVAAGNFILDGTTVVIGNTTLDVAADLINQATIPSVVAAVANEWVIDDVSGLEVQRFYLTITKRGSNLTVDATGSIAESSGLALIVPAQTQVIDKTTLKVTHRLNNGDAVRLRVGSVTQPTVYTVHVTAHGWLMLETAGDFLDFTTIVGSFSIIRSLVKSTLFGLVESIQDANYDDRFDYDGVQKTTYSVSRNTSWGNMRPTDVFLHKPNYTTVYQNDVALFDVVYMEVRDDYQLKKDTIGKVFNPGISDFITPTSFQNITNITSQHLGIDAVHTPLINSSIGRVAVPIAFVVPGAGKRAIFNLPESAKKGTYRSTLNAIILDKPTGEPWLPNSQLYGPVDSDEHNPFDVVARSEKKVANPIVNMVDAPINIVINGVTVPLPQDLIGMVNAINAAAIPKTTADFDAPRTVASNEVFTSTSERLLPSGGTVFINDNTVQILPKDSTFGEFSVDPILNQINAPLHGFRTLDVVRFATTGTLPTGLQSATDYYVGVIDPSLFVVWTVKPTYVNPFKMDIVTNQARLSTSFQQNAEVRLFTSGTLGTLPPELTLNTTYYLLNGGSFLKFSNSPATPIVVTDVSRTDATMSTTNHGFFTGMAVEFSEALPSSIVPGVSYTMLVINPDTFSVCTSTPISVLAADVGDNIIHRLSHGLVDDQAIRITDTIQFAPLDPYYVIGAGGDDFYLSANASRHIEAITNNTLILSNHGYQNDDIVIFASNGPPSGITTRIQYRVLVLDDSSFNLLTMDGLPVELVTQGAGPLSIWLMYPFVSNQSLTYISASDIVQIVDLPAEGSIFLWQSALMVNVTGPGVGGFYIYGTNDLIDFVDAGTGTHSALHAADLVRIAEVINDTLSTAGVLMRLDNEGGGYRPSIVSQGNVFALGQAILTATIDGKTLSVTSGGVTKTVTFSVNTLALPADIVLEVLSQINVAMESLGILASVGNSGRIILACSQPFTINASDALASTGLTDKLYRYNNLVLIDGFATPLATMGFTPEVGLKITNRNGFGLTIDSPPELLMTLDTKTTTSRTLVPFKRGPAYVS